MTSRMMKPRVCHGLFSDSFFFIFFMVFHENSCVRKIEQPDATTNYNDYPQNSQFLSVFSLKRKLESEAALSSVPSKVEEEYERKLLKGVTFHNSLCHSSFGLISSVCLVPAGCLTQFAVAVGVDVAAAAAAVNTHNASVSGISRSKCWRRRRRRVVAVYIFVARAVVLVVVAFLFSTARTLPAIQQALPRRGCRVWGDACEWQLFTFG